jgi:hypothetical protein
MFFIVFRLAGHDIARSVFEKSTQTPREGFWNNPEWMLFKSHLQVNKSYKSLQSQFILSCDSKSLKIDLLSFYLMKQF